MKIVLPHGLLDKELICPGKFLVKLLPEKADDYFLPVEDYDNQNFSSKQSFLAQCTAICFNDDEAPQSNGRCICLISPYDPEIQTPEGTFYILDKASIVLFFL